jgi:redox-sensitive bicupin YhaK (pirin superfamily)
LVKKQSLVLDPTEDVELELPVDASTPGEFLWMQGKPIEESVTKYGPFVMNTEEEIRQAFSDYRATQ